ncbi:MAG: hypothetical protein Q8909_07880 [Bacteroidota bacterium]|nr:hypothetical protein [Bacteroidota bacterium]
MKRSVITLFIEMFAIMLCLSQNLKTESSTFDNLSDEKHITRTKNDLKEISGKNVFTTIHQKVNPSLPPIHQAYFKSKPNYRLLYAAHGDLFQNKKQDYAFVVYDKEHNRISILVYNDGRHQYAELYRDIKVENGLENADCNYSSFGTLDYQIAHDIVYQKVYLEKKPGSYLVNTICKITPLTRDKDIAFKEGCKSRKISRELFQKYCSLLISTSTTYNNWEGLMYDKTRNVFIIFYGQAFAD